MAVSLVGSLTGAYEATSEGSTSVSVPLPAGAAEGDRFVVLGAAIRSTDLPSGWTRADDQYMGTGNWRAIVDYYDVGAGTPPTNYVTDLDTTETGTPRWAYASFLLRDVDLAAAVLSATATGGSAPSVTAAEDGSVELRGWCQVGSTIDPDGTFDATYDVYTVNEALAGRMYTHVAANTGVTAGSVGSATSNSTSSSAAGLTVVMQPTVSSGGTSGVALSAVQAASVDLTWDDNLNGPFDVLRDSAAIETGIAGTSFTDTTVTAGTTYEYVIRDASLDLSNTQTVSVTSQGGVFWLRRDGSGWSTAPA